MGAHLALTADTNNMLRSIAKFTFSLCISSCLLTSCCLFKSEPSIPEVLQSYIEVHDVHSQCAQGYSAYFDLSDGLLSAYQVPSTSNSLKSMVNKVTGNNNCKEVYTLKNNEITKSNLRQTELYNYILSSESYQMIAPIEHSLAQIIQENRSALLVTDFEEYDGGSIQQQNYAKKYFIEWLKRGNRIVFFVFNYREGNIDKHLYFAVFDTPDHILLKETEDALKGNGGAYKVFRLNNDDVSFSANYPAVTVGGAYHDESGDDIISLTKEDGEDDCYTIFQGLNAEYYPFEESWPNIVANVQDALDPDNEYTPVFKHLISGLKANFENMSGYDIRKLGIRITDIQGDFDKFAGWYAYKKNGDNVDDNGKVLPEFDYTKGPGAIGEVQDMFVFSGNVSGNNADISLDFRPHFSGTVANMPMGDLLRVDIVITECEPRYDVLPSLFEWAGNRSLIEAVKNTLQDQNPVGRVIYTYYIKAIEN